MKTNGKLDYSEDVWKRARAPGDTTPAAAAALRQHLEIHHHSLFAAALSLDQRASVMGAAFVTVASALIAAAGALSSIPHAWLPLLFMAAIFAVAGVAAFSAARPVKFRMPGLRASVFETGEFMEDEQIVIDLAVAAEIERDIAVAHEIQKHNGRILTAALILSAVAPIIGIIVFFGQQYLAR